MVDVDKVTAAVADLLTSLGVDEGAHTADTPARVARAWVTALTGYTVDPARHLAVTFPAPRDPGLVMVSGIAVRSTCAHHLLPIIGTATVAYHPYPGSRIVGLSKLARVVQDYAARLQVQENLGYQVADTIQRQLNPIGCAVLITATHGCMTGRGIADPGVVTTTRALTGDWNSSYPDVLADVATVTEEHARHR